MIIWITGISGSGKTTLTQGIYKKYKSRVKNLVCVDGDVIRDLYEWGSTVELIVYAWTGYEGPNQQLSFSGQEGYANNNYFFELCDEPLPDAPGEFVVSSSEGEVLLSWEKPESWIYSKGSSMRIASFDVPFSNGIGDLSIMELGGEGGGIVANVNRWRGQIGLNHLEENKIMEQTLIGESALGQYYKFKLDNKSNNKAILAAILPMIKSTLYIKLTASIDGVSEIEKDFNTFCSSFKPGNN